MEVDGNGPATSLGLSQGDVLTEIDGNAVNSLMDLKEALDKHKPGDSVTITINRSGQSYKATVQLGTSN
jgi:peptidase Do